MSNIQKETITGNLTLAGQFIDLDVSGLASLAINVKGTFVGTVIFEYLISENDWKTLSVNVLGTAPTATGATVGGQWTANVAGMRRVRVRCTSFTSGIISVDMIAVISGGGVSTGGSSADGAAHTAGITAGTPAQGVYEDTPTTVANNKVANIAIDNKRNLKTNLAVALNRTNDSITAFPSGATYVNGTADVAALSAAGKLIGIFFASASATPTCKIWDNTAASGTVIINTFTPVAGTWYAFSSATGAPQAGTGIYIDIGGTVDFTVVFVPNV